jgi:hypothetical protein
MQNGGLSNILNPYNLLSGGGITGTGSAVGSSLLKPRDPNNPYAPLNRSQISNLWSNGPAAGMNIPRGTV